MEGWAGPAERGTGNVDDLLMEDELLALLAEAVLKEGLLVSADHVAVPVDWREGAREEF